MTKAEEQCNALCIIPIEYKGQFSYPNCILTKGHTGPHRTAPAYGAREFFSDLRLCTHERLNEDGICRRCGMDRRGL